MTHNIAEIFLRGEGGDDVYSNEDQEGRGGATALY
jgi:hypothetical protein